MLPQRQLSATGFTSFHQGTKATGPQDSCKCHQHGQSSTPRALPDSPYSVDMEKEGDREVAVLGIIKLLTANLLSPSLEGLQDAHFWVHVRNCIWPKGGHLKFVPQCKKVF